MKTLITICMAMLCLGVKAQKFIDTKDPFTGQSAKGGFIYSGSMLDGNNQMLMIVESEGKKAIVFNWPTYSGIYGAFNTDTLKNMSLMFKMDNDTVFRFKPNIQSSRIGGIVNTSILTITSYITDDQLRYFIDHKVSIFRLGIRGDSGVDMVNLFPSRKWDQFRKLAAHMMGIVIFDSSE